MGALLRTRSTARAPVFRAVFPSSPTRTVAFRKVPLRRLKTEERKWSFLFLHDIEQVPPDLHPLLEEKTAHTAWTPGATVTVPLDQSVKELIGHSLKRLLEMYETEDHKTVVASLCLGLAETINKIGPAFIEGHLDIICNIAVQVLEQKALCQQDPDQDETEQQHCPLR
ncbi:hypothetical protein P692DRAFT_201873684 [Suillus brevipes Sb2]|nr:hypothetical protein P692DRAFT_201873684 [Suillus brevipes Sb2]